MVDYLYPQWQKQMVKFEYLNSNEKKETLELDIYNLAIMDVNRKKPEPPKKKGDAPTKGYYELMTSISIKGKPLTPDDVRLLCATFRAYLEVQKKIEDCQQMIESSGQSSWVLQWEQDKLPPLVDILTRFGVQI